MLLAEGARSCGGIYPCGGHINMAGYTQWIPDLMAKRAPPSGVSLQSRSPDKERLGLV